MRTRFVTRTWFVVALAALTMATVAAGATSRPAASYYTPAALTAMGERYQAMADWYLPPAASYYSPAALSAMGERWQAVANYYATRPAQSTPFQWNDALIGAGVAVGVVIALGAMLSLARGHAHLGRHLTAH